MDVFTLFGLILVIAATVSLSLNGAAKMLGFGSSLRFGLFLAVITGTMFTMFTWGMDLVELCDQILLLHLAVGSGCFSGLVSVNRGREIQHGEGSK